MRTAIVLQAFGSSAPEHQRLRRELLAAYAQAFPESEIRFSISSSRVRQCEGLPEPQQILEELENQGVERVLIQHLLLIQGQMFDEAQALAGRACDMRLGPPLIKDAADLDWLAAHLINCLHPTLPNIIAVHGNTRNPQHNRWHLDLMPRLAHLPRPPVLASLEGEPGVQPLLALRGQAQAAGGAHLIPLFLFPGGHVLEDLLGSGDESWAQRLGVPLSHSPTLLEQGPVLARCIERSRQALGSQ
ncbi:MAG: hypothetical protein EA402_11615 [Planctomycetota bacterium]|nr:MAG: hypothetical protein EA402_11615 [Planctomycetota bacterium]